MNKNEKKELFLLILENCFEDKTSEINKNNCISFYHFFIDYLQFEAKFNPQGLFGLNDFIVSVKHILCDLDSYKDKYIFSKDNFLTAIQHLSGINNKEVLNSCLADMQDVYLMAKVEFFI